MSSKIDFEDIDYQMALKYITLVGGNKLLDRNGLLRVKPKWKGKREDKLTIGGDAAKGESNWSHSSKTLFARDKKMILAVFVEILVHLVMSTHVYKFGGKFYLQLEGGPIGLRSTACLASLIMKMWDCAWMKLLKREQIDVLCLFRYVDDIRNFL